MRLQLPTLTVVLIGCLLSTVAIAKTPNDLKDLVGDRASSAESDMQRRGYHLRNTDRSSDRTYANWWNQNKNKCVTVAIRNGRYDSITKTEKFDCDNTDHHHSSNSYGHNNYNNSYSYNNNRNNYYNNSYNNSSEYDRGYRDGLHEEYHNSRDNVEYSTGYRAGVLEAHGMEDNNHHNQHHSSYSGNSNHHYSNNLSVDYLVGQNARSADEGLRQQGFRNVDSLRSGNTKYTIWYNRSSRQCLQMAVADGRADSITDIHSHDSCH